MELVSGLITVVFTVDIVFYIYLSVDIVVFAMDVAVGRDCVETNSEIFVCIVSTMKVVVPVSSFTVRFT